MRKPFQSTGRNTTGAAQVAVISYEMRKQVMNTQRDELHPIIYPGNKDWREYYRNNNLNLPEQYHNGGIWPFVGGFYIAALVKAGRMEEASRLLEKRAEVNRLDIENGWEFNEWYHGRTGKPMGYPHQAWSSDMYIFAYHMVRNREAPMLKEG